MNIGELQALTGKMSVLYVEDDPVGRESMASLLGQLFARVQTASDGYQGVELYKEEAFDMVITDIDMPGMDGLTMITHMRREREGRSFIIVSAHSESNLLIQAIKHNVDGFVIKPVMKAQLVATLHNVASAIHGRRKREAYTASLETTVNRQQVSLKESMGEVIRRTYTDTLTGLPNREKLELLLAERREGRLLLVDLDGFSRINTTYGYQLGNQVLTEVAELLRRTVGSRGRVYRLAADEFVVMAEGEGEPLANEIRDRVGSGFYLARAGINARFTATVAVVECGEDDPLQKAQIAVREARETGPGRVVTFQDASSLIRRQKENLFWMHRVREGLERDEMVPFFQPIVESATGKIYKYECLARLLDGDRVIGPGVFIEQARQVGVLPQITRRMIGKSFQAFSGRKEAFSLNITEEDLKEAYLDDYLGEMERRFRIAPERVTLEVLESISVSRSETVLEQLEALRGRGYRIALDDFGTEHANFSRIMDLQADYIKIDGRFIREIDTDPKSYQITRAVAGLAKSVGSKVVAEFVHSAQVYRKILELEIDYAQGYYFGEPTKEIVL